MWNMAAGVNIADTVTTATMAATDTPVIKATNAKLSSPNVLNNRINAKANSLPVPMPRKSLARQG